MKKIISKKIKNSINTVPDFPKKGIMFRDITSLIKNTKVFKTVVDEIVKIAKEKKINKIVGIDSRGFIFAAPIAYKMNIPLILVRKKGKLPSISYKVKYALEYGFDILEINKDSINKTDRIMVIDDLIATGGTALATSKLISKSSSKKINFVFVIELEDLPGVAKIKKLGHTVKTLCSFKEEEK